nr:MULTISPECIES: palindromic element RPE4 domain-containing protein [spotted fever group]
MNCLPLSPRGLITGSSNSIHNNAINCFLDTAVKPRYDNFLSPIKHRYYKSCNSHNAK